MVLELTFQRAQVHPVHDAKRLEEGKDLNDALLDFFVKLGQVLIPEAGAPAPVAFLGSHFYDVLRKGGVRDGREGHKNVANWARRRLGKEGLFSDSVGAWAVPVNEVLWNSSYEGRQPTQEKHWWLALLLNPRAVGKRGQGEEEDISLLCLDSFVRAETRFEPPIRANKNDGASSTYKAEAYGLAREGFNVRVMFRAEGDGSSGPLADPKKARLKAGGREFSCWDTDLRANELGGSGRSGRLEGALGFRLDRRGAAKTGGEYVFEYGDVGENYQPPLRLRMGQKPTAFQAEVARFLGGYLAKERDVARGLGGCNGKSGTESANFKAGCNDEAAICLPGVPQQETAHDCGFFILEMILRALQLTPKALRDLATASSVEIAMLPWPSQQQVFQRKARLREAMDELLVAAGQRGTGDVEEMFKVDDALRRRIRAALGDGGPSFTHGYDRWAVGDWDLSPSPSRDRERSRSAAKAKGGRRKRRRKRDYSSRSAGSRSNSSRGGRRRRRRRAGSSSSPPRRSNSPDKATAVPPEPARPSFTQLELSAMSTGALRTLCVQCGVLPVGIVERSDLLGALAPFVVSPPVLQPVSVPPVVPAAPVAVEESPAKQPQETVVPTGNLSRQALDGLPTKVLRNLCVQHGVLPNPPVERGDLIQALILLCS